jgi:hypothetical protein
MVNQGKLKLVKVGNRSIITDSSIRALLGECQTAEAA